ncbi:hypothetical protein LAG90_13660 [Marinilongibacter aquaticus]|uniref:hypothetical protein n=1 Tax=Marinilongibacter aquaticus TaxID=2975157 RepID=UPI0021BDEE05|nr:hypothetical protein [Marinilongibacter aquaticus]UBM57851.1 hypothetical protein LAG90_13660 [Marinilongibacter aquaticus]
MRNQGMAHNIIHILEHAKPSPQRIVIFIGIFHKSYLTYSLLNDLEEFFRMPPLPTLSIKSLP